MATKSQCTIETPTATIQVSQCTKAAIEVYRSAYLLFGNMLELRDMMIENDRMEADADDLEKVGNELIDTLRRIVGLSAVTDQEQELENVPSDLLEAKKEKQQ